MGWTFTYGLEKKDLVKERIETQETLTKKWVCLAHCLRGNVLWTVWEVTDKDEEGHPVSTHRHIGCDLLRKEAGYGYGYKDMCESSGPFEYSCPLSYLEMVPEVSNYEWRELVRKHHKNQGRKFELGQVVALVGSTIPQVTITRTRPLRGVYMGITYRVPRNMVGDTLENELAQK